MQQQNNLFWTIASAVFFGGLALILAVAFWPVALTIVIVGLVIFVVLWFVGMMITNERFRDVVFSVGGFTLAVVVAALYFSGSFGR